MTHSRYHIAKIILSLSFCFLFSQALKAQDRNNLQQEKQQLETEIKQIKEQIIKTKKDKSISLNDLYRLRKKILLRQKMIRNIDLQITEIEKNISTTNQQINTTKQNLTSLEHEYVKAIVHYYKYRSERNLINVLFNGKNLNDYYRYVVYLRYYKTNRQRQARDIRQTENKLKSTLTTLSSQKDEKTAFLAKQQQEQFELQQEKEEKNQVLQQLSSTEKNLKKTVSEKIKRERVLKKAIADAIEREIKEEKMRRLRIVKMEKEAADAKAKLLKEKKNKTPHTPVPAKEPKESSFTSTVEFDENLKKLTVGFEKNQHKMPWPVKGIVLNSFGDNLFEGQSVSGTSIGTTFQTDIGGEVRSINEGVVSAVMNISGIYTIIIRHGEYIAGYSNLSSVLVKKEDKIDPSVVMGYAAKGEEEAGEVLLQLYKINQGNLDPENWIKH